MKISRWLHLSDVHLNKKGVDTRRMRAKLLEYLKKNKLICDYVFFTGDLRYAPAGQFAEETVEFLQQLCLAVGTTTDHLYIVPGNHDVNRDIEGRTEAINKMVSSEDGYYNSREGNIIKDDLVKIAAGKTDFISVLEKLYSKDDVRILKYKDSEHPHFCIETKNFNLLHIDSTLSYSRERERNLIIGTELFMDLLEQVNQSKPSIILTHYSFDFLSRNEQKQILNLMKDYNVQLWFAGHEHTELVRMQRDYFYEFQCGNLLHEDEETKSEIIIGEYDAETHSGKICVHSWNSPDCWALYPRISDDESEPDAYSFTLQSPKSKINQIASASELMSEKNDDEIESYGINDPNLQVLHKMPDNQIVQFKEQEKRFFPGNRADIQTEKVYKGFIYLDKCIAPFASVEIRHTFERHKESFCIMGDGFQITRDIYESIFTMISFGYQLGIFSDVDDRLYRFENIRKFINAKHIFVKMTGHEEYNFSYDNPADTENWKRMKEDTEYWYGYMLRISKIEKYYKIKFYLPEHATDDDYLSIEIISDSIEHKSCRHLPVVPMKHPGFYRKFRQEEEVWFNDGADLIDLPLFGYCFRPVAQYILPGEFHWNKQKSGWESDSENGGVAVRVEFEINYDFDKNRELVRYIPFNEVASEFENREIVLLNGEDAEFFQKFIRLTHDIQEIQQQYFVYKAQIEKFIEYDLDDRNCLIKKGTTKIIDKLTVNGLTDSVIRAGVSLVKGIDGLLSFMNISEASISFSRKWTEEYVGYCFMLIMNGYAERGHLPISKDNKGYCYYDLQNIENVLRAEKENSILEAIALLREEFQKQELNLTKIDHYSMLRNFMFAVADIYKNYYIVLKPFVLDMVERMGIELEQNRALIISSGRFENYVVYMLEDEDILHAFERDENVMMDFTKFQSEADNNYNQCLAGMQIKNINVDM